jgi:hypothetical protein
VKKEKRKEKKKKEKTLHRGHRDTEGTENSGGRGKPCPYERLTTKLLFWWREAGFDCFQAVERFLH